MFTPLRLKHSLTLDDSWVCVSQSSTRSLLPPSVTYSSSPSTSSVLGASFTVPPSKQNQLERKHKGPLHLQHHCSRNENHTLVPKEGLNGVFVQEDKVNLRIYKSHTVPGLNHGLMMKYWATKLRSSGTGSVDLACSHTFCQTFSHCIYCFLTRVAFLLMFPMCEERTQN